MRFRERSVVTVAASYITEFVGTRPEGFRSRDGGRTWSMLHMGVNMKSPLSSVLPDSPLKFCLLRLLVKVIPSSV